MFHYFATFLPIAYSFHKKNTKIARVSSTHMVLPGILGMAGSLGNEFCVK